MPYNLNEVCEAASHHPLYASLLPQFAPPKTLEDFPFITKQHLYDGIQHLVDTDPSFLKSSYVSPSGGSSGLSVVFVSDTKENRALREACGQLMNRFKVVNQDDVCMVLFTAQNMYRSLDLFCELIDHAGGTALPVGTAAEDTFCRTIYERFHPNTLVGLPVRLLQFANHVLSNNLMGKVTFKKIIYAGEPLSTHQKQYLVKAFGGSGNGPQICVASVMGAAESGPWAVTAQTPLEAENTRDADGVYQEFYYDTATMIVEILDEDGGLLKDYGKKGEIVLTSMMKRRHPLIRYRTGDFGAILPCEEAGETRDGRRHQILKFYGRHPNASFFFHANTVEVAELETLISSFADGRIIQWQAILECPNGIDYAEIRYVLSDEVDSSLIDEEELRKRLSMLMVTEVIDEISVKKVDVGGLEKSFTAGKVKKTVDRRST